MYKNRLFCPLKCNQENPEIDTQEHLFKCTKLKVLNINNVKIHDVFDNQDKQENVGKLVFKILRERNRLIDELETESLVTRKSYS